VEATCKALVLLHRSAGVASSSRVASRGVVEFGFAGLGVARMIEAAIV